MASRVEICSFMTLPSVCDSAQNTDCSLACSIEILLELDVGARNHSFATKKQQGKTGIPCDHCSHLADTRFFELIGNCFEQRASNAMQAHSRFYRQRKYPAARRRSKFPGANLPDDKAQQARIRLIHEILGN